MIGLPSTLSGGAHVSVTEVLKRCFRLKKSMAMLVIIWARKLYKIVPSLIDFMVVVHLFKVTKNT